MNPRPEPRLPPRVSRVQDHYRAHAPHPGAESGRVSAVRDLPITRTLLGWVGEGRTLLDLGCHDGDLSALLRDRGNEVTGIDLPEMVQVARERHGLDAIAHDLNHPLPFEDDRFDVVVAASILDDIADDLGFLKECHRVLADGGELLVVVPNDVSLFRRIQSLLGRSSRDYSAPTGYDALHRYTLSGIRTLLENAGFRVIEHAKCPKRHSRIPLRYRIEQLLPATFVTDLALRAVASKGDRTPG